MSQGKKSGIGWMGALCPSRPRFARHLRMRISLYTILGLPHAEERAGVAGARLEARTAPDAAILAQPHIAESRWRSAILGALLIAATAMPAFAQKAGGILQMLDFASPASMSIHEESTIAAGIPMMGVFNNLVVFDQHVPQNSVASIVPDLASDWSWDEDRTALTFHLRPGVKWHDGKPFTAADVKCTWDRLRGADPDKFRINPRKAWYRNVEDITADSEYEVTFHLRRPQPYLIALLASGQSPVYPCHVPTREMRTHPIGTGPFKFVEYKPNERIRVTRNPDYWKKGRPYLDGIEYTIIGSPATWQLAFVAGRLDFIFSTIPLLKDLKSQAPQAVCDVAMDNNSRDLLIN